MTNISTMNRSHIVKATKLKLFAKFHDDCSKQSVSIATWPNYANYEVTHALTCIRRGVFFHEEVLTYLFLGGEFTACNF